VSALKYWGDFMARRVLVLSDIDGTLVDHPFLSGSHVEARRNSVERMFRLFENPNFGIVTGRRKEGFERFFREYDLAYSLPHFLAVEFATHHAVKGEWVVWRERNDHVNELMKALKYRVELDAEFGAGHDVFMALQKGKIETYFLEEKTICAQIEAHFPSVALQQRFFSIVEEHVNPLVTGFSSLTLQSFASMGRLDVLEKGFVPKAGFWPTIERHREAFDLVVDSDLTIVALGDELYDSYMFRYLKDELCHRFHRVFTVSVGKKMTGATHVCAHPEHALSFVERILETDSVDENTFKGMEVVQ
jgi:trehalose-6-phosphatase